ncbi:MAG: hypothetical protein BGO07_04515 [Alphaproteobacteria bacterium 40-19]|nr:MAG: hypothetical protein BGO07_04515 [Alphaproteobacteria bacterium 40-19]
MVVLSCDHGGRDLALFLQECLVKDGICVEGAISLEQTVDYPCVIPWMVQKVRYDKKMGILVCGSGIGMSISANRYQGIRAALCHDETTARLARQHNNANILVLGGRLLGPVLAWQCVQVFLKTTFEGGHHQSRLAALEKDSKKVPFLYSSFQND